MSKIEPTVWLASDIALIYSLRRIRISSVVQSSSKSAQRPSLPEAQRRELIAETGESDVHWRPSDWLLRNQAERCVRTGIILPYQALCSLWSPNLGHLTECCAERPPCLCSQHPDKTSPVHIVSGCLRSAAHASEMQLWILSIHSWALDESEAQKL